MKIKVCGMADLKQVNGLVELGVEYAGFIFYEKSPRCVKEKILPAVLKTITGIKKVGVFVNEKPEQVSHIVDEYGLNLVQLHGDESVDYCIELKKKVAVIKAFRITGDENIEALTEVYHNAVDYFLFDTKAVSYGGTGKKFDWSVFENAQLPKPYFLSGGIGPGDVDALKTFTIKSFPFAVDINSKFEIAAGVKDLNSVQKFLFDLNTR